MPYVDRVRDVFLLSRAPDRLGSYRGYRWGPVVLPPEVDLLQPSVCRIGGRVDHPDGSRCRHDPAGARLMAVLDGDRSRLLTETAACWGTAGPNVSGYGYYGLELGNFGPLRDGEKYEIRFGCGATGEAGSVSGTVGELSAGKGRRQDIALAAPAGPRRRPGSGGTSGAAARRCASTGRRRARGSATASTGGTVAAGRCTSGWRRA